MLNESQTDLAGGSGAGDFTYSLTSSLVGLGGDYYCFAGV